MSKTYQIKAVDAKGQALLETIQPGASKGPVTLQALPGVRYTLIDVQQGSAPDNIRVQRTGKHLRILFDGASQADLVLENYFDTEANSPSPALVGTTDSGTLHEYVPENGRLQDSLPRLGDGLAPQGMALGGLELPASTGAAVALLAPVAGGGIGLGAAGAGVLGAAALGGGGGGGADGPKVAALSLAAISDTGPAGDNITNQQKPTIVGKASPGSLVEITLNGNIKYTVTADASTGDFSLDLPTDLNPGQYKLQATASRDGVVSEVFSGSNFTIDTSNGENFDASGKPATDANARASLTGLSLSNDTGSAGDLMTSDPHQKFTGTLANYSGNGNKVLVTLSKQADASFQPLSEYLTPNAQNEWTWDQSALSLATGKYTLKATLVDGAGNEVHSAAGQSISRTDTITVSAGNGKIVNPDGTVTDDANSTDNASAPISSLSNDTGISTTDFITSDNTLIFKGLLDHFTRNGDMAKVQLKDSTGAVLYTEHINPSSNAWTWDLSSHKLADGQYELVTSIVDAGGTVVSGTSSVTQKIAIDTSASKNQGLAGASDDANGKLGLVLTSMTDTANGYHSATSSDKITNNAAPVFSGHFGVGKTWSLNGDQLRLQVQNRLTGEAMDLNPSLVNGNSSWTSAAWTTPLTTSGIYIAKASVLDAAGNVLNTTQQAFALDKVAPSLQFTETVKDITLEGSGFSNGLTVSRFTLSSNEFVHYTIKNGDTVLAEGDYSGLATTTNNTISGSFDAGTFSVTYTDIAGNTSNYTHASKLVFNSVAITTTAPTHGYTDLPAPLEVLGPVGILQLTASSPSLDLTHVIGEGKLHNQVDMTAAGAQRLTLNLNDVLSVGVANSFLKNDLLQLRVDGDSSDSLVFKDRDAWNVATSPVVTLDSHSYTVYTSYDTNQHLVEVLVQQGIVVS